MEQIDEKLCKSSRIHENHIRRIASEAKLRNEKLIEKMVKSREIQEEKENNEKEKYEK